MDSPQSTAEALDALLTARGVEAHLGRQGPCPAVRTVGPSERTTLTRCLSYPGENTTGIELHVQLEAHGTGVTEGRVHDAHAAAQAVVQWMGGASVSEVERAAPFIGERRRRAEQFAERLPLSLRRVFQGIHRDELWVYGENRFCGMSGRRLTFFLRDAQVADYAPFGDPLPVVTAWLLDEVAPSELAARGASVRPDADLLLRDPAAWHWLGMRRRVANPDYSLAPLADVVLALADCRVASTFFCYSSHGQLKFSASSHCPWVGDFPRVRPTGEAGVYWLERLRVDGSRYGTQERCGLDDVITAVETALAASPVRPFFGTQVDLDCARLTEALVGLGSRIQVRPVRYGPWARPEATVGGRTCRLSSSSVTCWDGSEQRDLEVTTEAQALALVRAFLEDAVEIGRAHV